MDDGVMEGRRATGLCSPDFSRGCLGRKEEGTEEPVLGWEVGQKSLF